MSPSTIQLCCETTASPLGVERLHTVIENDIATAMQLANWAVPGIQEAVWEASIQSQWSSEEKHT